jgi:hypothetical protein
MVAPPLPHARLITVAVFVGKYGMAVVCVFDISNKVSIARLP